MSVDSHVKNFTSSRQRVEQRRRTLSIVHEKELNTMSAAAVTGFDLCYITAFANLLKALPPISVVCPFQPPVQIYHSKKMTAGSIKAPPQPMQQTQIDVVAIERQLQKQDPRKYLAGQRLLLLLLGPMKAIMPQSLYSIGVADHVSCPVKAG